MKDRVFKFLLGLLLAVIALVVALVVMIAAGYTRATPGFGFTFVMTLGTSGWIVYLSARVALETPRDPVAREVRRHRDTFEAPAPLRLAD